MKNPIIAKLLAPIVSVLLLASGIRAQQYEHVKTFGETGTAAGQLDWPAYVTVSRSKLFVTDYNNHRVGIFSTADQSSLGSIGSFGTGPGQLKFPAGIASDVDGNLHIGNIGSDLYLKLSSAGDELYRRGGTGNSNGLFSVPRGISIAANGDTYIVDCANHRVQVFDKQGTFRFSFGSLGSANGQLRFPFATAHSSTGEVFVVDRDNYRVQVFDQSGNFLRKWGSQGAADGQFQKIESIFIDEIGTVYVADSDKGAIFLFDQQGNYKSKILGSGTNSGTALVWPMGMAQDENLNLYIVEHRANRIRMYKRVDNNQPESTFTTSPAVEWSNSNVTATITSTDNVGGTGVKEVHYSINQGTEQVVTGSNASFTVSDEGVHSVAYWAVDNAGNIEATKYGTVRIDKTAPSIDGYVLSGKLTLLAADGRSGVAAIKYSLDGAAAADYTSSLAIPAGAHTYTYWSVDNAGNESVKETILVGATVSVTLAPTSVYASKASVATVKLSVAAPASGVTVMLASSNPAVTIAPSVKLNAGATSINVPVQTGAVVADTSAVITATVGGVESYATLLVMVPYPKTLVISPNVITGGNTATGTVSLQSAAPVGGQVVTLTSMHPDVTVPSTVTVPAGALSATFTVTTKVASKDYSAAIYAEADDAGIGTTVLVKRVTPKSVTFAPSSVIGGNTSVGTVTLNVAAPTGGATVMLKSTSPLVTLPTSVTVAEGQTTVTFDISTTVTPRTVLASIQAAAAGVKVSGVLTVSGLNVLSVTLAPNTVLGGTSTTGSVNLNTNAPAGGVTVQLYTTSSIAGVPVSVTVPEGQKTATFTVTTSPVSANAQVQVVGKFLGVARPATLTVQAAAVSTVTLNPTSVKGGTNSTMTIKLSGLAGPAGLVVTLTSSNINAATVPATVTVPAGTDTVDVVVTTKVVTANTTSTMTAKTAAGSKTAVLTVTK